MVRELGNIGHDKNGLLWENIGVSEECDSQARRPRRGRQFTQSKRAFDAECFKWGTKLLASSLNVKETGIWARR
jgi:hypothetical protein